MPLCFIEPQDAIRVIAESVGREARRQLVGEVVRAWVDEIPDRELEVHYAKAIADLDEHDLSMLAAWHASLEVGQPIANRDFLVGVFNSLGDNKRVRANRYSVNVRLWIDHNGGVERVALASSTGDPELDGELERALDGIDRFAQAPPADMPQPVRLRACLVGSEPVENGRRIEVHALATQHAGKEIRIVNSIGHGMPRAS